MIKLLYVMMILFCVSGDEVEPNFANKSIARVIQGWRANLGDVPYQVSFKVRHVFEYKNFCGGTIIAANKVLSAAHCFALDPDFCDKFLHLKPSLRIPLQLIYAVAGSLRNVDEDRTGQWRKLKNIHYPTSFEFPSFDICVVVTRRPFIFDEYVNYIPYASKDMDYTGTCLVSGFGSTSRHYNEPSQHLLLAHAPMLPMKKCDVVGTGRKFICSSPPSGPHQGDSGGPLVCYKTTDPKENSSMGILVGVTCAGLQYPPYYYLYTRVSSHKDLIDGYVNTGSRVTGHLFILIHIVLF